MNDLKIIRVMIYGGLGQSSITLSHFNNAQDINDLINV